MVELKIFKLKNAQIFHMFAKGQSPQFNNSLEEDRYLRFKNRRHGETCSSI